MGIEVLIKSEMTRREAFLNAKGSLRERDAMSMQGIAMPTLPPMPEGALEIPGEFITAAVSAKIYRMIGSAYGTRAAQRALAEQPVTAAGIEEAREYVSSLMDVDLSTVMVEVVPNSKWGDSGAEGIHFKAGLDQHLIVMPSYVASAIEVLVHEFGHAAHAIKQRQNGEYPFFFTADGTVELISHYCQYHYIVERLSRDHLLIALGQLTTASYALSIQASGTKDFDHYEASGAAAEPLRSMSIDMLQSTHAVFCENQAYYFSEVFRGISLMLALLLLDENEGMRRYASLDRVDRRLQDKLSDAFAGKDVLMSFSKINERIEELLERCS